MIGPNSNLSERVATFATKSGTASSTALVAGYAQLGEFRRLMATFVLGDMAAETIDCRFVAASDGSGTGKATLKGATQLAAHASNNDNKCILINLSEEEVATWLASNPTKTYVGAEIVTGNTTGGACGIVIQAGDGRHGPVTDFDNAAVVEVVA